MKTHKKYLCLGALGLAIGLNYCAQIDKENISTNPTNNNGSGITNTSTYNSTIATHVTSAPCQGLTTNGCVSGFNDSSKAVNGVRGAGWGAGSFDVFSLSESTASGGIYATLILDWAGQTVKNVSGIDFIVYENGFDNSGTYGERFMDLIVVTVSSDNINYCGWLLNYKGKKGTDNLTDFLNAGLTGDITQYSNWPEQWVNFAGKSPVAWNVDTNPISYDNLFTAKTTTYYDATPTLQYSRPDLMGGGDSFDLDNLVTDTQTCTTPVLNDIVTNGFKYVKLTAAHSLTNPSTSAIYPHYAASNGPDIDGVIGRNVQP